MMNPDTQQQLWNAIIALLIALAAALQQWNASRGKKRGEQQTQIMKENASTVSAHSEQLDRIEKQTNGATQAEKVAELVAPKIASTVVEKVVEAVKPPEKI
jgi:seryl-tRNA(Sec) selenium transferase